MCCVVPGHAESLSFCNTHRPPNITADRATHPIANVHPYGRTKQDTHSKANRQADGAADSTVLCTHTHDGLLILNSAVLAALCRRCWD